jgi:ubiquinone/menaquinone biosynthesis C-methylase UbiE
MTLTEAFSRSAHRYDLLTGLNPGYGRELRDAAQELATALPPSVPAPRIWDLGCGSGLSTRAVLEAVPDARVLGVDASEGMLAAARAKPWPSSTRFLLARAEELATSPDPDLAEDPDAILAAYLFRNLAPADRDETLAFLRSRLRPGGLLVVHDYSVSESRRAQAVWTMVCGLVVLPLSRLVGADTGLYQYLWRSVLANDSTARFLRRLEEAGLEDLAVRTGRGWHRGVLHTYTARRPGPAE